MIKTLCTVFVISVLDSRTSALTQSEKNVGISIASKLDSLTSSARYRSGSGGGTGGGEMEPTYLDMMLVLDSSGSIGSSEFREAKEATTLIVNYVDYKAQIYRGGSQVGLIQFSSPSSTRVVFSFGDHNSAREVNRALGRLRYTKGTTATGKALRLANEEFQKQETGWNAKVVWLLTDGKSNKGTSPITEAKKLKRMGVTVCVVAIGSKVKMSEINGIADRGCVYKVSSFGNFRAAMAYGTNQSKSPSATDSSALPDARPTVGPDFFNGLPF